ncbi:MAG: ABC transporter ATP-binding protein [Muribaculaceae bacterium]|nr:ABC transporter ATP-binding protein [Muribaculaceae bacterium]
MRDMWRFFRRFGFKYKRNIVLNFVFNILTSLMTIFSFAFIIPILQMLFGISESHYDYIEPTTDNLKESLVNNFYYFIDHIISVSGASLALALLTALLIGMTLLKVGTAYLTDYFIIPMRNGIVRDLRETLYDKILSLPIGFFSNERKGDIISRVMNDVGEVENSVSSSLNALLKYPIMILVCLAMMIFISWQLTVFVFVLLPVAGFIMGRVGKKLKAKSLRQQQMAGSLLSTTEETIGGLRVVKAFNAEGHMERLFRQLTDAFYRLSNAVARRNALAHPMSELLGTIAIGAVLWFGGSLIISGNSTIDAAGFIYYMVIFYSIINPAKELAKTGYAMQRGLAALQRVDEVIDAENPIKSPAHPRDILPKGENSSIEFKDVSFAYEKVDGEEKRVLRNIELEIKPGQTVAIVGQSGSGKSTLADLIPRLWDVTGGSLLVNGVDVREADVTQLRSMMGIVNQEPILFNDTIYNNIAFGDPSATEESVIAAAKMANAHEFIMQTPEGYSTNIGDRGNRLSGGQRQRLSIARALLRNPSILILDEATSALDTESERLVQEALDRLMHSRTTIVIAHRLSTIVNADLICVLQDGRIVERGTHSELMNLQGAYHKLVMLQQM